MNLKKKFKLFKEWFHGGVATNGGDKEKDNDTFKKQMKSDEEVILYHFK